jgi:hypothetical protein
LVRQTVRARNALHGDTATDYRIGETEEQYITNLKTDKKAMCCSVAIYRGSLPITSDMTATDSFQFETTKTKDKKVSLAAAATVGGLLVLGMPSYFIGRRRKPRPSRDDVGCRHCGYPVSQSMKWKAYSNDGEIVCRACYSPLDSD